MSGEITLKKNTTNTQSTNNEESNKVHYHLSANVKYDEENAFHRIVRAVYSARFRGVL